MSHSIKKIIISTLYGATLLTGVTEAKEIKIGVIAPLSGAISGYGQPAVKGVQLMNEIKPMLKNGDIIKLVIIDDKGNKIEAANAMQKLVSSEKVTAVIGELISTNTLAITKIADESNIPLVSPAATSDRITRNRKYVSRVCLSDSFQGVVGANLATRDLKAKTAAIILDNGSDYSIGLAKAFRQQFLKNGGKISIETQISAGSKDFKAQLSSIKAKNVDVIYLPIYYTEAALIAVQAQQLNLKVPVIGGDGIAADPIFFTLGKDAVNGYMTTDYYSPEAKQTHEGEEFITAYQAKYKEKTHTFAAMAADAYNLIINSMNQCEDPSNSICVNDKIRATKNFTGVTGTISLKNGDAIRDAVINEAKDGKLIFKTIVNP